MTYNKRNWVTGDVLTSTEINRIETGINDITNQAVKTVNSLIPDGNGDVVIDTSKGSTSVPMASGPESNLTTIPNGTYYFCTDSFKVFFGTPVGNLYQGTVTIAPAPPSNNGGGSTASPNVILSDDFNRTDSSTTPGTSDSYAGGTNTAWVVDQGTFGISANQLYTPSTTGCRAHVNAGVSDAKMEVKISAVGNEHDFYFRVDTTNPLFYYRFAYNTANGGTWFLQEGGNTFTTIWSGAGTLSVNDVITVECVGSTATLSQNGNVIYTANALTDLQTNTGFGIGFSGSTAGRLDNFKITSSSIPTTGGGDTTAPVLTVTPNMNTTFTTTQSVTMTATDANGVTIYYTTDGSDPKTSGTKKTYSTPLSFSSTTTVKAFAQDPSGNQSATQTVIYTQSGVTVSGRPANYVTPDQYGAVGNGTADDTAALQSALNAAASAGKAVIIPATATYKINPANFGLRVPTNTTLWFDQGGKFTAFSDSNSGTNCILRLLNTNNVNIIGYPRIIGEWTDSGTNLETHMGIYMQSASNTYIENANISDCNGDGIYIGDATGTGQTYCLNTTLKNVICNHNSRNGISVISADGLTIASPTLTNNNGTLPKCGIDFEPNLSTERLANITMTDPYIQNNGAEGIHFWIKNLGSYPISVTITNMSNVKNNATGSVYFGGTTNTTVGYVKIDGTYYLNK